MLQYINTLQYIINQGELRENRTGVDTIGKFGYQMSFNLNNGFPAVTTKKLAWKSVVSELLWFLEGSTDERRLAEIHYGSRNIKNKTIWTANADNQGKELGYTNTNLIKELGPIYGYGWRNWNGVDQITDLIQNLKTNPFSRRHILTAWNVSEIDKMALPPCHVMAQFHVNNKRQLSCQLYQRSVDAPVGLPFNIASYSLLTHMLAKLAGLNGVDQFIHTSGDLHIYVDHIDAVKEQLKRVPYGLPTLKLPDINNLDDILNSKPDDYKLINYQCHPTIKMKMVV